MRHFSFLYTPERSEYTVIAKNQNDDCWYVVVDCIKYRYVARQISEAMNLAEQVKYNQH